MIYKAIVSSVSRSVLEVSSRSRNMSSSGKYKVYITRNDMPEPSVELLKKECDLQIYNKAFPVSRETLLKSIPGVNGIYCALTDKIDKEVLDAAGPSLKVIGTISVGYDHIDVEECVKRGIKIGYTPGVLTDAVAELTIGLLLCTSRCLPEAIHEAKTGGWGKLGPWAPMWMTGPGLAGANVGIFGLGNIGIAIARRIKTFNPAKILFTSRTEKPEAKEVDAIKVSFDELLAESDFVICACSLVPETAKVFNKAAFEKMKRSAIFVNISRGGTVDQDALIDALQKNVIRAAGLDVTTPEPLPPDNPLFKLKNCVVLPHIGSATIESRNTMGMLTANNILTALNGKEMPAELLLKPIPCKRNCT